jgi:hypothetical protein
MGLCPVDLVFMSAGIVSPDRKLNNQVIANARVEFFPAESIRAGETHRWLEVGVSWCDDGDCRAGGFPDASGKIVARASGYHSMME